MFTFKQLKLYLVSLILILIKYFIENYEKVSDLDSYVE